MDWHEARAAICNRAQESSELQLLWEEVLEKKNPEAARLIIEKAQHTAEGMLIMLDEWVESAAADPVIDPDDTPARVTDLEVESGSAVDIE